MYVGAFISLMIQSKIFYTYIIFLILCCVLIISLYSKMNAWFLDFVKGVGTVKCALVFTFNFLHMKKMHLYLNIVKERRVSTAIHYCHSFCTFYFYIYAWNVFLFCDIVFCQFIVPIKNHCTHQCTVNFFVP